MSDGAAPIPTRRCARCGHPTRADRLVKGFGADCAAILGLTGRTRAVTQTGPDLFDAMDEDDMCDGWDRP
jgi:hypothetical protein